METSNSSNQSAVQDTEGQPRRGPLENLSKEDLVKKCKGLLGLAQKAKQAKDEYAEENKQLMEKLSKFETQKEADKNSLITMKEMVDTMMESKVELTSQIDNLQNQNQNFVQKIIKLEENVGLISEMSIKNEALERQLKRLTDENEDLINDLEKMEKQFQNVSQEYSIQQHNNAVLIQEATDKLKKLEEEFLAASKENQDLKENNKLLELQIQNKSLNASEELNKTLDDLKNENVEYIKEIKKLKEDENKLVEKIQYLKIKVADVAVKFKKLKICKKVLMQNQIEYSESVSKWQKDIKNASRRLVEYIKVIEKDKTNLQEQLKSFKNKNNDCSSNNEVLNNMQTKIVNLLEFCEVALKEFDEKTKEINKLNENLEKTQALNNNLNGEIELLKTKFLENLQSLTNNQNLENENVNKTLDYLQQENTNLLTSVDEEKSKCTELELKLNQVTSDLNCSNESYHILKRDYGDLNLEMSNKSTYEKSLTQEISDLKETFKNFELEKHNLKASLDEKLQEIERMKYENSELLSEMRELNEALKGRGDVISRQQDKIGLLEMEIKNMPNSSNNKSEPDNTTKTFSTQKSAIKTVQTDLLLTPTRHQDNQSEILSVSSITRAENSSRLRDVDESFEEKYNKLKMLAIKLKKKVQEQTSIISELEKTKQFDNDETSNTNSSKINQIQLKNLQALQNENDRLLDEIDQLKKYTKDNEREIKQLEEKTNYLQENLIKQNEKYDSEVTLRKDKEQTISEKQNEIKTLKQEKDAFNLIKKELEKERDKLKNKLIEKEKEISKFSDQLEKSKKELEKSKAIGKQSNVLNLEVQAYEKSLNETSDKLNTLKVQNKELSDAVQFKEETNISLKQEIKILEDNIESEKLHSNDLKQQIDIQQSKIKQIEHEKLEIQTKIQELVVDGESKNSELEDLRLQLSEISSKKDQLYASLKLEKENIYHQLITLQETAEATLLKLKTTELDLENTRTEYASYKIRAQSILRQSQSKETCRERELEEELIAVQARSEHINSKLTKTSETLEAQGKQIDELRQENERLKKRSKEFMELLEESRLQNDSLLEDNRKQNKDYQESLKSHRLQIETLNNCYKKQIEELEDKHSTNLEELKKNKYLEAAKSVSRIGPFGAPGNNDQITKSTDEQKIDLILMEREDAEGSEASYTIPKRKISTRSKHDCIPLDELLNLSLDETPDSELMIEESIIISSAEEAQILKEKLQTEVSKTRHLTALLSETEQDLVKYTQLSEVLKEELRRQERTLEREKHMPNSEYLKNIVLKFLTLGSGDERSQLVPVLNTILKLSPEETHALQNVAKGFDNPGRSWSNLLPIWSNNNQ